MKAKKQLRKPENWQDFESLCKKLWGEIWNCPEIKKNGRKGQPQHGVDVYGVPDGGDGYYGIQCKGKDDYAKSQLSQKEIDTEIKKAKKFKPALKKFYFATTANKNSKIERYIREKNLKNKKQGLFEVHLFSWEDMVDLIDDNKVTHDWYLKSQNFRLQHSIKLTFQDDQLEKTIAVPFIKRKTHYIYRDKTAFESMFDIDLRDLRIENSYFSIFQNTRNNSVYSFSLMLHNNGSSPLENYKIRLVFEGEFESINTCSVGSIYVPMNYEYDTYIDSHAKVGIIIPKEEILVPGDKINFDDICLKPIKESCKISIKWSLVSLNFSDEGELTLNVEPKFKKEERTVSVKDKKLERTEESIVEDICILRDNNE